MESAEAVAAKRRVLIDALMMCLSKSRVVQVVDGTTVRGVLDSASKELWREGEFRLEPVWKILIAEPGLTAEDVAPPLLMFKAYENELGVLVRIPQALSAIPRGEQVRLRDALGIQRADFARAIDEMRAIAASEVAAESQREVERAAPAAPRKDETRKTPAKKEANTKPPSALAKLVAAGLAVGAVVAIVLGAWLALRDTSSGFDLSDVASTLQLADGKAAGPSLTATIADPRWEAMSAEERKKAVSAIMDIEVGKGIKALTLLDKSGRERAAANETPGGRVVMVP